MGNSCTKNLLSKICPTKNFPYSRLQNIENSENKFNYKKIKVLQLSSSNEFILQGNYKKLENYDILKSFLNKPLVKIYMNQIFKPNKTIKKFQYQKIKGLYNQIKPDIDKLFSRYKIKCTIPKSKFNVEVIAYKLSCNPSTEEDLDMYFPIFFMELCLYPKSFIKKSQIKQIVFVHDIEFTTPYYSQERSGCPDYYDTKGLILSTQERNFAYIRIVFHHEFFHYIDWIDDKSYDDDEWNKLNEPNFKYGKGGEYERTWIKLDPNVKGFINHYSTSALEEDKAEIYQYLIGCPDEALHNKDDIVKKKALRIQKFINDFNQEGIGNAKVNFWNNLIDFRKEFVYKESVYQGNIHLLKEKK